VFTAGCGSGSGSGSDAATTAAPAEPHTGTVRIKMETLAFDPSAVRAGVGQRVVWVNKDDVPHNVIYVSGPRFTSSPPRMTQGQTFSIRLTQPGTIHYFCSIHPWMKATIAVSQ
jgi:plastocyanin